MTRSISILLPVTVELVAFFWVHAVLIGAATIIGLLVLAVGVRGWQMSRQRVTTGRRDGG